MDVCVVPRTTLLCPRRIGRSARVDPLGTPSFVRAPCWLRRIAFPKPRDASLMSIHRVERATIALNELAEIRETTSPWSACRLRRPRQRNTPQRPRCEPQGRLCIGVATWQHRSADRAQSGSPANDKCCRGRSRHIDATSVMPVTPAKVPRSSPPSRSHINRPKLERFALETLACVSATDALAT
jgi:hypothetical protein